MVCSSLELAVWTAQKVHQLFDGEADLKAAFVRTAEKGVWKRMVRAVPVQRTP
jgi:hypothetical protein